MTPLISKSTITTKPYMETGVTNKHYTTYGQDNRNAKMCRFKEKEEPIVATTKVTNQP